jgi:hypothetical protein
MAETGGSVEEVTLRGRRFTVAADADTNRKLGGFENELQANGDGTARQVKTRVPWMIDGLQLSLDDARADHEFLQEIADGQSFIPITVTFASGTTYQGRGTITGELQGASQNATGAVSLSGPGKLEQQ